MHYVTRNIVYTRHYVYSFQSPYTDEAFSTLVFWPAWNTVLRGYQYFLIVQAALAVTIPVKLWHQETELVSWIKLKSFAINRHYRYLFDPGAWISLGIFLLHAQYFFWNLVVFSFSIKCSLPSPWATNWDSLLSFDMSQIQLLLPLCNTYKH